MIQLQTFQLNNIILSKEVLSIYIDKFWSDVFNLHKEDHLFLLCKIRFSELEQGTRTLGHLVKINYEDKQLFLNYLSERLSILNDSYVTLPISQFTFTYIIKSGKCTDENRTLLNEINDNSLTVHNFNNMNLPITMDPFKYGEVRSQSIHKDKEGIEFERFIVINGNKTFEIDVYNNGSMNKVTILGAINLSWIDTKLESELEYFRREIKKSTIYFMGGEIVLRKKELPAKAFRRLSKDSKINTNFITLDIESISKDNVQVPYLITAHSKKKTDDLNQVI